MVTSINTPSSSPTPGVQMVTPVALPETSEEGFQLKNLFRILRRRQRPFLITAAAVTLLMGARTLHERATNPVYKGGFSLMISDPVRDSAAAGTSTIGSVARNQSGYDLPTLKTLLESPAVLEPVYKALSQQFPGKPVPGITVSLLDSRFGNATAVVSGVLQVSAQGRDPELVLKTLQLTEGAFLNWALAQRREKLNEGVKFLDQQAPVLAKTDDQLQAELEAFRARYNMVQPLQEVSGMRAQVEQLRTKLLNQQSSRALLAQTRDEVASGKLTARGFTSSSSDTAEGGSATNIEVTVPNQPLLDELNRLETSIAEAKSKYRPDAPLLQNLIASRERLRPLLQAKEVEAMTTALAQYDSSINTTKNQIRNLEARFSAQPALLKEYDKIVRRLRISEENLNNYQSTRDQFQLEIAQNNVPWKVISASGVNPNPVEPQVGKGLLQALLLGLVSGTGVALLRERLDHVFHTPGEVREALKRPLLGHIPYIKFFEGVRRDNRFLIKELDEQQSGVSGYQRFYYQEAFRNLYTSLRFLNSDEPLRSITLTSSVPSEGKSLAIVLLAKTLSEVGQRVLLIDADMRKPQLHTRLGLNNLEGLSNILTEESPNWRAVVQPVQGYSGWDVITAGRRVPDPPRLLSSERMKDLVKELADSGNYDMVLYDTPPVIGLSDAALVAEHTNGVVMILGLNKVDRSLPSEAIRRIEQANVPLLGLVTNARTSSASGELTYGYGSGRYGYGSYTSGYVPHDPSTAYSYYQTDQADDEQPKARGLKAFIPNSTNIARWRKKISGWIEG